DGADAQAEQARRAHFGVTHEVAVKPSPGGRTRERVGRQREVVEADLDVAARQQRRPDRLVERALCGPGRDLFVSESSLLRLDPGNAGEAVDRKPIGPDA